MRKAERLFKSTGLFLLFSILPAAGLYAQDDFQVKFDLASQFYQNGEIEKSIELYEELYKKKPTREIYIPLINAYISSKKYEEAEKLAKKEVKRFPGDALYVVDLGFVQKSSGEIKKGEEIYRQAIRNLPPNASAFIALSNSFQRRGEFSFAIECLQKGKKVTGESYGYEFELGELYYQSGDIQSMIDEYLDLLEKNDAYLQDVQNALNTSIYLDPGKDKIDLLNQSLLRRIQKDPDNVILPEMLIWHYLQQKDFRGAITQTRALDKRNNENGYRFLSLARSCRAYREYDMAIECYQIIISKGPSSSHYINARILSTETIREKITSRPYTGEDVRAMEENYLLTLKDLGKSSATISLQIGLAEVWAFYLGKSTEAVEILNHAIKYYQMKAADAARCKILLADIYLSINEVWEASLLYSQVEKDFKYEAMGDEAKFKNALIYFYTGDFGWAKAQLDVLKGSTSKLISNDALRLSLLISDNTAFDTNSTALRMYGRASLAFEQQRLDQSIQVLDSMINIFPVHNIIAEVWYLRYKITFRQQNYTEGAKALEMILSHFSDGILADKATYYLATLNESYLNDSKKALELYQSVFTTYPGSVFAPEARQRFRKLRGDDIN